MAKRIASEVEEQEGVIIPAETPVEKEEIQKEEKAAPAAQVKAALDATREEGLGVLPFCPFVHRYVSKDPEYLALVPEWARERLGLPAQ